MINHRYLFKLQSYMSVGKSTYLLLKRSTETNKAIYNVNTNINIKDKIYIFYSKRPIMVYVIGIIIVYIITRGYMIVECMTSDFDILEYINAIEHQKTLLLHLKPETYNDLAKAVFANIEKIFRDVLYGEFEKEAILNTLQQKPELSLTINEFLLNKYKNDPNCIFYLYAYAILNTDLELHRNSISSENYLAKFYNYVNEHFIIKKENIHVKDNITSHVILNQVINNVEDNLIDSFIPSSYISNLEYTWMKRINEIALQMTEEEIVKINNIIDEICQPNTRCSGLFKQITAVSKINQIAYYSELFKDHKFHYNKNIICDYLLMKYNKTGNGFYMIAYSRYCCNHAIHIDNVNAIHIHDVDGKTVIHNVKSYALSNEFTYDDLNWLKFGLDNR